MLWRATYIQKVGEYVYMILRERERVREGFYVRLGDHESGLFFILAFFVEFWLVRFAIEKWLAKIVCWLARKTQPNVDALGCVFRDDHA